VAGPLHLKTLLTLCGEDTLCASVESGDSFTMLKVESWRRDIQQNDAQYDDIQQNVFATLYFLCN
jgi:hypothetical protein